MTATAPTPAAPLSPAARTAISLALFVHFFAVGVAALAYTRPSELVQRLRTLLAPYNQTLSFDLTYRTYPTARLYWTHGAADDVDFTIEVEFRSPDNRQPLATHTVPDPGLAPGVRRWRYQALANAAGTLAGNEDYENAIPRGVVGGLLSEQGQTRATVRLRGHNLLTRENAASSRPADRDPFAPSRYTQAYEADAKLVGGRAQLVKSASARETAPVRPAR
jgi:hypothetical protein